MITKQFKSKTHYIYENIFILSQEQKIEPGTETNDDVLLLSPLDEAISHSPNDLKYDALTGYIPFKIVIINFVLLFCAKSKKRNFFQINGDKVFTVRRKEYTLSKTTLNYLKSYNTNSAFKDNDSYDTFFVNSLLVSFISVEKLKRFEVDEPAQRLIQGNASQ